jgi:uncharacterized membrane protein
MTASEKPAAAEGREPHHSDTARLEAFCDGVFAIAITLLVLEIRVPDAAETHAAGGLWGALAHRWPSYLGYVISFITIGIMWANHHAMFRYIRRSNRMFVLINVLFLMCISFLPFPTALLAEYLPEPTERVRATVFYGLALVAIAVAYNVLWLYGIHKGRLLGPGLHEEGLRTITQRYRLGPVMYLLAVGLAFVSVAISLALHAMLAIFWAVSELAPALPKRRPAARDATR